MSIMITDKYSKAKQETNSKNKPPRAPLRNNDATNSKREKLNGNYNHREP